MVPALQHDARTLRELGERHGVGRLTTQKLERTEAGVRELAALATLECDRQGAYRGLAGTTCVFMTFGSVSLGDGRGGRQTACAVARVTGRG